MLLLLLLGLVCPQNWIATASWKLLHLLLEFKIGSERHLRHWRRMLLLLRWWLLGIASFQDWPALGLWHRWHLLTRVGLLQIPGNVSTGHARWLVATAHLLVVRLLRRLSILGTHSVRMVGISHVVMGQLWWGSLRLVVWRLKGRMRSNERC